MSEFKGEIMIPDSEKGDAGESSIVLPENKVEIFGGTIEGSLNELLGRHVKTAQALERAISAQHALKETMDRAVVLLQDPLKSEADAVKELVGMMDLQKKLAKERGDLEVMYKLQEAEYATINDEMSKLAKEHPELFILASESAVA